MMSEPEERTRKSGRAKESFVQRLGPVGLIGGAAALITGIAILVSAFGTPSTTELERQQAPPAAVAAANPAAGFAPVNEFALSDYWSGVPEGTSQPLTFHFLSHGKTVLGTMRNPCQGDLVVPIDSGSWDGSHLTVHLSRPGSKEPTTLDVNRVDDRLEGSVVQTSHKGHITLRRGELPCLIGQAGKSS